MCSHGAGQDETGCRLPKSGSHRHPRLASDEHHKEQSHPEEDQKKQGLENATAHGSGLSRTAFHTEGDTLHGSFVMVLEPQQKGSLVFVTQDCP
jgi:hypothetical protein